MNPVSASAQQLQAYAQASLRLPPVLFYQYTAADAEAAACREALAALARRHRGALRWAGLEEQVLIGDLPAWRHACLFHFAHRDSALAFVLSAEHAAAVSRLQALQVTVITGQPKAITRLSNLFARVLPHLPYSKAVDNGPEPGLGVSQVIPSATAIAELLGHPRQDQPVTMVNWLRFRAEAAYASGEKVDGRTAYYRYGKVALLATHRLGAKLLQVGRYQLVLIGNGGDPGLKRWDEFALMQYPGRATFHFMSTLKSYRAALADREAGLAPTGQGLSVTRPLPEFVWRR